MVQQLRSSVRDLLEKWASVPPAEVIDAIISETGCTTEDARSELHDAQSRGLVRLLPNLNVALPLAPPAPARLPDTRTTTAFVIVWFPPDAPRREARKPTLDAALAYIEEKSLAQYAPLVEQRTTTITEAASIVWNSADGMCPRL